MGILKSAIKYKAAKKVTTKAFGDGVISTVTATRAVKRSNNRVKNRRMGRR